MSAKSRELRNRALQRPLAVFEANQDKFAAEHHGQFVVIHGDEVDGFYDNELQAYETAKSKYGAGSFLLQRCVRADEEVGATFHSRVG